MSGTCLGAELRAVAWDPHRPPLCTQSHRSHGQALCVALRVAERVPKSHISHHMPSTVGSPLPSQLVEEALQVCRQHLDSVGHQDIDRDAPSPCTTAIDWERFLQDYYRVVQ